MALTTGVVYRRTCRRVIDDVMHRRTSGRVRDDVMHRRTCGRVIDDVVYRCTSCTTDVVYRRTKGRVTAALLTGGHFITASSVLSATIVRSGSPGASPTLLPQEQLNDEDTIHL